MELASIFIVSLVALVVNVPLGRWRASVPKFSFLWFLAVHLSIPLIVYLRIKTHLGISYIPVTIAFAVLGQYLGGLFYTIE
ncbi:hypothetical protein [Calderihabitans maritimus]|uniref:Uncharacterized protein n=1 Tax=Calderihabitans maritimus TaxID=1246530 RepID=A0A1Z5HVE6_9FIRM|nr:hypothetical protein [Calderihabitans maritimus]GAW93368.1 hypothetical protein GM18_0666 [Calderihabitans maritimus]